MAKKKKRSTPETPSTRSAKTNPKKKATRKKSTSRKQTSPKPSTSTRGQSVDGILKKYQKERITEETRLAKIKTKIADLETKTVAYRQQIEKLTEQEIATEQTISQLDARRDAEVTGLLTTMGIQLDRASQSFLPDGSACSIADPVPGGVDGEHQASIEPETDES